MDRFKIGVGVGWVVVGEAGGVLQFIINGYQVTSTCQASEIPNYQLLSGKLGGRPLVNYQFITRTELLNEPGVSCITMLLVNIWSKRGKLLVPAIYANEHP